MDNVINLFDTPGQERMSSEEILKLASERNYDDLLVIGFKNGGTGLITNIEDPAELYFILAKIQKNIVDLF